MLMLQLIDDLIRGYRNNETWSLWLLNSTRIHILPSMNPDGFDQSDTHCQYSQGRYTHTQHTILFCKSKTDLWNIPTPKTLITGKTNTRARANTHSHTHTHTP